MEQPVIVAALATSFALLLDLPGVIDTEAQPYISYQQFSTLDSGEPFSQYVLSASPPISSTDYDGCPHSTFNVLAYTLVIDPETGYADYPSTYGSVDWSAEQIRAVVGEPRFTRSTPPGLPWAGAYAWERFENAAKLAESAGMPGYSVASWWLQAAWAVRLDSLDGGDPMVGELSAITELLPRAPASMTDLDTPYQIQLARLWEMELAAGRLGTSAAQTDVAIAWLYRSRGELRAARLWLERYRQDADTDSTDDEAATYVGSSINLESEYLQKAQEALETAWAKGTVPQGQQAAVAFTIAELHRRLGDLPRAALWYDEASAKGRVFQSPRLLTTLKSLVAAGRGY